ILAELARALGTRGGMIGGQVADLEAERKRISARELAYIHRSKTGALIRASVRSGAVYAGASAVELERLTRYGEKVGLAFQIVDDILDVRSSTARLGKPAHHDAARHKATYPALHGLKRSEQLAAELIDDACAALRPFGRRAAVLEGIARYLLHRSK
ncbi:MAG: polyprenyl synthetase family protein, partial [Acidobacteria bacterium]|nr:polyprenyl synthetase family protein [Acidobacteriota bacterium]